MLSYPFAAMLLSSCYIYQFVSCAVLIDVVVMIDASIDCYTIVMSNASFSYSDDLFQFGMCTIK